MPCVVPAGTSAPRRRAKLTGSHPKNPKAVILVLVGLGEPDMNHLSFKTALGRGFTDAHSILKGFQMSCAR